MINKSLICGILQSEPTFNKSFSRFNLSITEEYTNKEGKPKLSTTSHPITLCGRVAESFCEQARLGDVVLIDGKLVMYVYTDEKGNLVKEYRTFGHHFAIVSKEIENI